MTTSPVKISGLVFAVAAGLFAALWLSSSTAPASATAQQTAAALDTVLADEETDGKRADLRKDLKAARQLEGQARMDAVKKIKADAKAGKYGDRVEKRADRHGNKKAAFFALLPDELQADLKAVKAADQADRKTMREDIRKKALDGGYGDKVKEAYELLDRKR